MPKKKYSLSQNGDDVINGGLKGGRKDIKKERTKEEKLFAQFKTRIDDLLVNSSQDDHDLLKWLKARQFDVSKAEQMFRTSMAFREKMDVDALYNTYTRPEILKKYLTGGFCGYDKAGSPMLVERYGCLDMKGIMYSCKKVDLERAKLMQCEGTVRDWQFQTKKLGRRIDGITVVFDMQGVNGRMLWRPGLQMYLHMVKVLEDNYPEMMKQMFVINAPRIFPLLYKICRPLISEDMKNKIHVLGGHYLSVLLEHIDADQLPEFLGGTLKDKNGDPFCSDLICPGGDVPESYYLQGQTNNENMETAVVPRGDKLHVKYVVDKPGSVLRWEFQTENFDIAFGVFFLKDNERIPVVPMERVNSHMVPEDGSYTCEEAGTYELCFDNTFSWARGKKIQYWVEAIAADDSLEKEIDKMIGREGGWDSLVISETTVTTRM